MAQLLKLAQVNTSGVQNQDLTTFEIVGDSFTFGGASGTNVTKTIIDLLISTQHAPGSDNQNVVAGAGLAGGGSGSTVNLSIGATDSSIVVGTDAIGVGVDPAGGIIIGTGLALNIDGVTLQLVSNALSVKDQGISTPKLADGSVTLLKVGTDTLALINSMTPMTRNISTTAPLAGGGNLTADRTLSISQSGTLTDGYLSSTDWNTFNNKQTAGAYLTDLTGDVTATGPGSAAATVAFVGGASAANVASATALTLAATSVNTNSAIVRRDGSGNFSATTITANLTGTASGNVPNARAVNTTAPLTGGGALTSDLTLAMPAATGSVDGYLTAAAFTIFNAKQPAGNYITALTGDVTAAGPGSVAGTVAFVGGQSAANVASGTVLALAATDANTANAIVKRDANGNFSAGTISTTAIKGNVVNTLVAGETFAANTSYLVRWAVNGETAGRVYKATSAAAQVDGKFYAMGVAFSAAGVAAAGSIDVVQLGTATLGPGDTSFGGTDIGKALYLTTAGAFSVTPPTASAAAVYRIGMVRSTTQIYVGMQQLNGINP